MFLENKTLAALASFEPPQASLLEIRDRMNELFPRHVFRQYDALHVKEGTEILAYRGLAEMADMVTWRLTDEGQQLVEKRNLGRFAVAEG